MKLPANNIGPWAKELIDECFVSLNDRRNQAKIWRAYYFSGSPDGTPQRYNRCYAHVDRLASFLFSPVDVRFDIEFEENEPAKLHAMADVCARKLNREFHRCNVDLEFASGVTNGLVEGCTILKTLWGHDGLEGWLIRPGFFGVLREDIAELDRQEAFVHSTYLTKSAFKRTLIGHPEEKELMGRLDAAAGQQPTADDLTENYLHQVIIGSANQPVRAGGGSSGSGRASVIAVPQPQLDPKVAKELIRVDELWVLDDDRQDWTTIRMVDPEIVVEGKLRRRNLLNADGKNDAILKGEHPFTKICPNETEGYFWGQSEIAQIYRLQDKLNDEIEDLRRLTRLKSDPPRGLIGFTGMTPEKYRTLKRPGGYMSEENPNAKIETLAPDIPQELFVNIEKTIQYFDDVAGFTPIMMGQGEQGVRAGVHASTLARNSSPRLRDRALLVERQCVEAGDFALKLLQAKIADEFKTDPDDETSTFLLAQLNDFGADPRVTVDSHTASPAFAEDAERKADKLIRTGAIDEAAYIQLLHPPHEDRLVTEAKIRAKAKAKLVAEHPELLLGKGRGKRAL